MSSSNRRAHQRHPLTAEGWIAAPGGDWLPISTVDVSRGGFGFISREHIEPGALCQFRLQLPDNNGLMHVLARIAHCVEMADRGSFRVGVQTVTVDVMNDASLEPLVALAKPR